MSKEVTMRDIARELNISAVSVSKAITGKDGVSDEVRAKILKTAMEMGYEYTSPKLTKEVNYNFGVIVSQAYISESAFYSKLFQSLSVEFGMRKHSCTLEVMNDKDEEEGILPGSVSAGRVDGLVVLGPIHPKMMEKILRIDMPCLFLDNCTPEFNMDCVVSDNVYGSHMLTNYLIRKGHRKIAFVGSVYATNSIMDRYLGYMKGLMQNGLDVRKEYVLSDRDDKGNLIDVSLPDDMPDAFVCNCDETAYHLINQLNRQGIVVPDDVSVVGFDDYIFATLSNPQLTTFRVDMDEMSRCAAEILIKKMEDPHCEKGRRVINGEIIIRDSVKDRRQEER